MDKVRQVGENYELNKYKTLNKTVELDARLANDRLLATKLRLSQVSSLNDKLGKQLRLVQQQCRAQEKKLLLTETMLRQLIDNRETRHHFKASPNNKQQPVASAATGRLARLRGRSNQKQTVASNELVIKGQVAQVGSGSATLSVADNQSAPSTASHDGADKAPFFSSSLLAKSNASSSRKVSNSATQTQMSRTKMIISDLRQRLNLVSSKGECCVSSAEAA